jgi:ATP/maltotriose-dependent transcriptional regulator MalT
MAEERASASPSEEAVSGPPTIKLVPPRVPAWYVARPTLEARLDEAARHRLTTVVAGAGFGKSTHVAARARVHGWAWYAVDGGDASPVAFAQGLAAALRRRRGGIQPPIVPPLAGGDERAVADSLAVALARMLEDMLEGDLVLVVDDAHELGRGTASAAVLEGLSRYAPDGLHLLFSSREEPPFPISRLRASGAVLDVDPARLAFTREEVASLLERRLGEEAVQHADRLHELTGGWPAAIHLAAEILAGEPASTRFDVARATARSGTLYAYLAEDVLAREPERVWRLLSVVANFDTFSADVCLQLGLPHAREDLAGLAQRGLVTEGEPGSGAYTMHDLVRGFVVASRLLPPNELQRVHRAAARSLKAGGRYAEALRELAAAADGDGIERFIRDHWLELVERAAHNEVIAASAVVPDDVRPRIALSVAHAHILRGDSDEAAEWLGLADYDDDRVSFFRALIHVNRAEPHAALEYLVPAAESSAICAAFAAHSLIDVGRVEEARRLGARARELARAERSGTAIADAKNAAARLAAVDGDLATSEAEVDGALELAERIGNVLAACSARAQRARRRRERGKLREALDDAVRAAEDADRMSFSQFQGLASIERGRVHLELGELDEAEVDFEAAARIQGRLGSGAIAAALIGLGDVERLRGRTAQARSAYERALAAAERASAVNHRSDALAGLARVRAPEEPTDAELLANESVEGAFGAALVRARLARGWVAARVGDRARAGDDAEAAAAASRRRGAPLLLAEALELRAASTSTSDEAERRAPLEEALSIHRRAGSRLRAALDVVALERLDGAASSERLRKAEEVVRVTGADADASELLALVGRPSAAPLEIRTFGRFVVLRAGRPAAATEWQSKKARDLLKLLVARRGHATPRRASFSSSRCGPKTTHGARRTASPLR